MQDRVRIACPYCGWRGKKASADLQKSKVIGCPMCHALFTAQDGMEAATRPEVASFLQTPERSRNL